MTDLRDYLDAYAANGHQPLSEAALATCLPPKSPGSTVPNDSGSVASAPSQPPHRSRDPSPDGWVVRYGRRGFPVFEVQCPAGGWDSPSFSVGVAVVRHGPTHGSLGDPCTEDRSGKHRRDPVQEQSSRLHRTTHPRSDAMLRPSRPTRKSFLWASLPQEFRPKSVDSPVTRVARSIQSPNGIHAPFESAKTTLPKPD